jgi:DNA-binding XRE family transcriptional regulator
MAFQEHTSFAGLLKQYRAASGLTQEGLAERAHLSREAVSALERGGHCTRAPIRLSCWQNYAAPPTRLLSRDVELVQACRLLTEDRVRLLTLSGPPGGR